MNPDYPIYIISKGRWESRYTSAALDEMDVPYHIVVEPQEFDNYSKVIDPQKIYVLPFSNLGQGSIPARNWVWEHSISIGAKRHWILDDNIKNFLRLNRNRKIRVTTGTIFKCAEDFVNRYENIAISGFNYRFFGGGQRHAVSPFYLNTRIYSCILILNKLKHRWRGKYNEDTDLSLRTLKDGWCTVLFNAFMADKQVTMTMSGGNTDELYKNGNDSRLVMTESLIAQHPDVVTKTWKFGHWHHQVNYKPFQRNKLILKEDIKIPNSINNYGMKLVNMNKYNKSFKKDAAKDRRTS